jgi:hypothetical protein
MSEDKLPGTEGMKCAIGLYEGSREYVDGPFKGVKVHGVFSYVDVSDEPCNEPVKFWCKRKGSNHAWLACANPEHRRDAETVLELTPEYIAFLQWQQGAATRENMPEVLKNRVKRDPFLDAPKRVVEAPTEPKALPAKTRIPRNKKRKKPRTLTQAIERLPTERKAEAYKKAGKTAVKVFAAVMSLVDKDKR